MQDKANDLKFNDEVNNSDNQQNSSENNINNAVRNAVSSDIEYATNEDEEMMKDWHKIRIKKIKSYHNQKIYNMNL